MNYLKPSPRQAANHAIYRSRSAHTGSPARRLPSVTSDVPIGDGSGASEVEGDVTVEDDPVHLMLKERWSQMQDKIAALFGQDGQVKAHETNHQNDETTSDAHNDPVTIEISKSTPRAKKPARQIEDDYGDDDEDDDDDDEGTQQEQSPLHAKGKAPQVNGAASALRRSPSLALKPVTSRTSVASSDHGKSTEDVRKKLEEDKRVAEDAAKKSFHTMFFTLESDRDAMLEQQKLDELDRQVENEMSDGPQVNASDTQPGAPAQGSLSTADLGASSLTLKNLIARVDMQRSLVRANDAQLRHLISEVRKGRSKWASEDKIGQEELYEAAEKVLMELKAMTEYSTPFLQRVNKRDAPDYFHVIKHPMDIGSMIKKLKQLQYKSKRDFVGDLNLIWSNCLQYNADPNHPLRKKALYMRKETDKLVPLIPDVTVRDRAEVEAEERRNQGFDNDPDAGEDSEDDRPIMASRGRKAPSKGKKGPTTDSKEASVVDGESTPVAEGKPPLQRTSTTGLRNDFLRGESDAPGDSQSNGFSTPPPAGNATPFVNGVPGSGAHGSQPDIMDVEGNGPAVSTEDLDEDDAEFRTWKQITKKDRATAATERHKLFRQDHLNPDEPALLRSKVGMRRWTRQQKQYMSDKAAADVGQEDDETNAKSAVGETLAEGIEKDSDRTLPDYYDTLTAIPSIYDHLKWQEDSEGNVVPQTEEYLRLYPANQFTSSESSLTRRMESNMRQMQETRKVCAKIGIVKQMQIQAQTYQNQFQKYDPQPFVEQDVDAAAVSEDGPIMNQELCRAAFQRAVGKIFYHAGFEDFQPSALDAVTDIASDYFIKLTRSLGQYVEAPPNGSATAPFSQEEQVLHCLDRSGQDLDSLDLYIKDDMDKMGSKLVTVHERLRSHLAELLVSQHISTKSSTMLIITASRPRRKRGPRRRRRLQRRQRAIRRR